MGGAKRAEESKFAANAEYAVYAYFAEWANYTSELRPYEMVFPKEHRHELKEKENNRKKHEDKDGNGQRTTVPPITMPFETEAANTKNEATENIQVEVDDVENLFYELWGNA